MERVDVSEFEAECSCLLEQVKQTGEPIEIWKNGEPLAVVYPPPLGRSRKAVYGSMKHTLLEPVGDLVTPLDKVEWEVLRP
jgi:prevent-host-death family protein